MKRATSLAGAMATALLLVPGFALVWGIPAGLLQSFAQSRFQSTPASVGREDLWFDVDDEPFVAIWTSHEEQVYRDLAGQRIANDDVESRQYENRLLRPPTIRERPWIQRVRALSASESKKWFLLQEPGTEGHCYFVGYDVQTRAQLGFIGTLGYRATEPADNEKFVVPFGIEERDEQVVSSYETHSYRRDATKRWPDGFAYVISAGALYEIDLAQTSAKKLVGPNNVQRIYLLGGAENYLAIVTETIVTMRRPGDEAVRESSLPRQIVGHDFSLHQAKDGQLFAHTVAPCADGGEDPQWRYACHDLLWFDAAGTVLRTEHVPLRSVHLETDRLLLPAWTIPSPMPLLLILAFDSMRQAAESPAAAIWQRHYQYRTSLLIVALVIVLCVGLFARRQWKRGCTTAENVAWGLFVALFGVPGLLAYLFHRRWPPRVRCPNCGQRTPADRLACVACGREAPEPKLTGAEIFA